MLTATQFYPEEQNNHFSGLLELVGPQVSKKTFGKLSAYTVD